MSVGLSASGSSTGVTHRILVRLCSTVSYVHDGGDTSVRLLLP